MTKYKFELSVTHYNGKSSYHITLGVDTPGTLIGEFDTRAEAAAKEAECRERDEKDEAAYWEEYRRNF